MIASFSYIYISYCSVASQLKCGGIFSNHFIVNCPRNVPVKNCKNRSIIGEDMDKRKVARFYGPRCISYLGYLGYLIQIRLCEMQDVGGKVATPTGQVKNY